MKVIAAFCVFLVAAWAWPSGDKKIVYSIQNRIAGGEPAQLGQFPFQVGVQGHFLTEENEEYTTWCGGSLISDQAVLTAAHCVHKANFTEIFLGQVDLNKKPLIIDVPKASIFVHEEYMKKKFSLNDVAVVMLPQSVQFTSNVQAVNLPRRSQRNMSFEKTVGWISGWGRMGDEIGSTTKLQFARRWILPDEFCRYFYPAVYTGESQICVDGSHGISACRGDSGGPLTIEEEDGSRTLVGLASYERSSGCEKNFPVVYQRVTAYLDWISEKSGVPLRE